MKTRQKILDCALDLFSIGGFDAVSVEQIAVKVGIKAPSLYSHFRSKEEMFDEIIGQVEERYANTSVYAKMSYEELEKHIDAFASGEDSQIVKRAEKLFLNELHDEIMQRDFRLMTIEQYKNERLSALNSRRRFSDPVNYYSALFRRLIKEGVFADGDPKTLAIEYIAPIATLMEACERTPSYETEALKLLKKHVTSFAKTHRA